MSRDAHKHNYAIWHAVRSIKENKKKKRARETGRRKCSMMSYVNINDVVYIRSFP